MLNRKVQLFRKAGMFVSCVTILATLNGCGSAPVHATFISNEKSVWVEDHDGSGLSYCIANSEGGRADPLCYVARKADGASSVHAEKSVEKAVEKASEAVPATTLK